MSLTTVPDAPAAVAPQRRSWALINNTKAQYVSIGPRGVRFERDPIRYMRTAIALGWAANDDMLMLPETRVPQAYTEALAWLVPSDDAASTSSSSSGSPYSSDDDSDTGSGSSDDDDDDSNGGYYSSDYGSSDADDDRGQPTAAPANP